ncbi:uncharacterized protein BDZ83DRAFT_625489 [Colletotrichum acutatum]|uniref:Uncharacterized protein n=1 Tax=Glomerella acutata TaxID=27357 RepID=A0AAD8XGB0_GLOAC|nr:uncharacterized protein BDZ83DRAFT_625489 [Colletotrichum acutatum]KAK1723733.1 hypothetical protein BDZ83DRAFT_625489 [Colletotrichum acutatum]
MMHVRISVGGILCTAYSFRHLVFIATPCVLLATRTTLTVDQCVLGILTLTVGSLGHRGCVGSFRVTQVGMSCRLGGGGRRDSKTLPGACGVSLVSLIPKDVWSDGLYAGRDLQCSKNQPNGTCHALLLLGTPVLMRVASVISSLDPRACHCFE